MEELLTNIGIDNLNSFIYEYEPIKLDWWNSEYETSIEIETHQDEEGFYQISIIFCPEAEGIVERSIVYIASFKSDSLKNQALIEKRIYEKLIRGMTFDLSEEQNAYITDSYKDAKNAFIEISNLVTNKNPIYKVDLKKTEDDDDIVPYELGDTLDHFIAMMYMNSTNYTEENIVENIELSIELEGTEYLSELKNEVDNEIPHNFKEDYDLDDETFEFLKKIIKNYTQQIV